MSSDVERLARIETTQEHTLGEIREVKGLLANKLSAHDRRLYELESANKILKIFVGLALLGGVGGGSSILLKLLGG